MDSGLESQQSTSPQLENGPETEATPLTPLDIEQLFKDHHSHLVRFVQRYVRNVDDARDVVQNTFLESVRCADRFTGASKPSTWLFGIALNLARNHVRRSYASLTKQAEDGVIDGIPDFGSDPADLVQNQQLANRVEQMLEALPDRIRETFEAVLDDDASYADAAEKMQIPIGTVRSRVSRVRDQIRTILE